MKKLNNFFKFILKKRLMVLLTLIAFFSITLSASSQTSDITIPIIEETAALKTELLRPEEAVFLNLSQTSKAGLLQNFDIQIAEVNWDQAKLDVLKEKGRYDLMIDTSYDFEKDRAKQATAVLGNSSTTKDFKVGLSKKLPTGTTVGVDYRMLWERTSSIFSEINPGYDSKASLTLKQALLQNFLGIIDRTEVNIARIKGRLQGAESMENIENEILKIRSAYWELALALEDYQTEIEFLQTSESLLKIGERKFIMGTMEKADLLNLMSQTRARAAQLLVAENYVRIYSNQLANLLGIDMDVVYLAENPLIPEATEMNLKNELDIAFKNRELFKHAKLNVERFGLEVKKAAWKRLPQASVTASVKGNGLDTKIDKSIKQSFGKNYPTYFLGFEFHYPLENRQARAGYKQSRYDEERSQIQFKKTVSLVNREVSDAYTNILSLQKQLKQIEKVVELDKEKYFEEKRQFKIGRSNTERLTQFQNDWIRSRFASAEVRKNLLVAKDQLSKARGTLLRDAGLAGEEENV